MCTLLTEIRNTLQRDMATLKSSAFFLLPRVTRLVQQYIRVIVAPKAVVFTVYRVLLGKPEGRRPLRRSRRRWVDNIRMDLQEVGCGYIDWIGVA